MTSQTKDKFPAQLSKRDKRLLLLDRLKSGGNKGVRYGDIRRMALEIGIESYEIDDVLNWLWRHGDLINPKYGVYRVVNEKE
jgi:DNA replicative helicase MCM subunit Mcm2 (Cdc46/Mcm family)